MRATLLLLAFALALGCSKPAPPTLTPERAIITKIGPEGLELRVELTATNPNQVDLSARELTAHVVLDKRIDLGTVTAPEAITIPAGKSTKLEAPLALKWTDLSTVAQLAANNRNVPYVVNGTLGMGGSLVHVEVPYHFEGMLTHDQLVNATINSLPRLPGRFVP